MPKFPILLRCSRGRQATLAGRLRGPGRRHCGKLRRSSAAPLLSKRVAQARRSVGLAVEDFGGELLGRGGERFLARADRIGGHWFGGGLVGLFSIGFVSRLR